MFLCKYLYPHEQRSLQAIGQELHCVFGCKAITHVEQIKWPMADFHLGQHPLFRKHAYTVTCHLAPGAPQGPTLPLRGGPPFCSASKMIFMHENSWGGAWAPPFIVHSNLDISVAECLRLCICGACMCESVYSHPCLQMGVSLVSGVSMIGRRRWMPSPSVKMQCTVYAESTGSI